MHSVHINLKISKALRPEGVDTIRGSADFNANKSQTGEQGDGQFEIDLYPANHEMGPTPAALVLPGGGFWLHTELDGEGYAKWLNSLGIAAAVLRYKLRPDPFPTALLQARLAFEALQSGSLISGTDASRTGVIGSSAGGLLAGLLATRSTMFVEQDAGPIPRPAFHVQSYGVADLSLIPDEAVRELLGEHINWAAGLSPAKHVQEGMPPSFIWATAQDAPGLPNALEWARALSKRGNSVELHVFPEGDHGAGLADGVTHGQSRGVSIPHTAEWARACERWLAWIGMI